MQDRECIRFHDQIFALVGLRTDQQDQKEGWTLSWDDRLELETLVGTDYATAVSSLAAAITPIVRRRVEALGDLLPIADDMAIDQMAEPAYLAFLAGVFEEAGIPQRFSESGKVDTAPVQLHPGTAGPEETPEAS